MSDNTMQGQWKVWKSGGAHIDTRSFEETGINSLPVKICSTAPDMCLLNDALLAIKWVHWSNSWKLYSLHLCGWQFLFVKLLLGNNCYFCKQKLWQHIIYSRKKNPFEFWSNCHYCHFCTLGLNDNLGPKFLSDFFLGCLIVTAPWWTILLFMNKTSPLSFIAFSIWYVQQRILFSWYFAWWT